MVEPLVACCSFHHIFGIYVSAVHENSRFVVGITDSKSDKGDEQSEQEHRYR